MVTGAQHGMGGASGLNTSCLDAVSETLALDFANTTRSEKDHLAGYHDLILWCQKEVLRL